MMRLRVRASTASGGWTVSDTRIRDGVFCAGLLASAVGLWWISPAVALIIIGVLFMALALAGWWLHREVDG